MSVIQTNNTRRTRDHFEPQDADPQEQRRVRGLLEQIDYSAFVANREIIGQMVPRLDAATIQRLAVMTATARARWIAEALRQSESGASPSADMVARLQGARVAYDELSEAYEGLRRMVERGYVTVRPN